MRSSLISAAAVLTCSGCAAASAVAQDEAGDMAGATLAASFGVEPPAARLEGAEDVGEAASESVVGTGCRAACAIAHALGCVSVGLACSGAATITLGGATIPCTWAIVAACGVLAPGGNQICMAYCPE